MHSANCLICNQPLNVSQKFCDRCGQHTKTHRLSVGHVTHEFFHAFTHADTGIIFLIKALDTNPGRMAGEYVEGKRKKYFSPFSFLLICIGFFVLVNNVIKTYPDPPPPDPKIVAVLPTPAARQNYIGLIERTATASKAVNKHANIITLIAIPLYSLILWLFFKKRGRNFAEIMIAVILFTAFASLCTTILINPFMAYYKGTSIYFYLFLMAIFIQSFYYTWGFSGFFNYRSLLAYFKVWLVLILIFILWIAITMFIFFYYVYGNKTFVVIGALWKHYIG